MVCENEKLTMLSEKKFFLYCDRHSIVPVCFYCTRLILADTNKNSLTPVSSPFALQFRKFLLRFTQSRALNRYFPIIAEKAIMAACQVGSCGNGALVVSLISFSHLFTSFFLVAAFISPMFLREWCRLCFQL